MLRTRSAANGFVAVPLFGSALAMGTLDQIKAEFGNELDGDIQRSPITDSDLKIVDGAVQLLAKQSLVQAIAAHRNLETNQNDRLWDA